MLKLIFVFIFSCVFIKANAQLLINDKIQDLPGSEDLTYINDYQVLVGSDNRRLGHQGGIYLLDVRTKELKNLTLNFAEELHPHGISFTSYNGVSTLFVINHRIKENTIEVFNLINGNLEHQKTLRDKLFIAPNDLVAIDNERFYFTNDHFSKNKFLRNMEDLFRTSCSNVCFFDGEKSTIVAQNIAYANGINIDSNKDFIYVASVTKGIIFVYLRDKLTNNLHKLTKIKTRTGVDNIEVDEYGNLWVGCHSSLLKFVQHAMNENNKSPYDIVKINLHKAYSPFIETILHSEGTDLSGVSVCAVRKNKAIIGSVFENHILTGELKK